MSLNFGKTIITLRLSQNHLVLIHKSVIFVNNLKRTSVLVVGFTLFYL